MSIGLTFEIIDCVLVQTQCPLAVGLQSLAVGLLSLAVGLLSLAVGLAMRRPVACKDTRCKLGDRDRDDNGQSVCMVTLTGHRL